MSPLDRRQRAELQRELEPHILPRQLRALERVAERLDAARPRPDVQFRADLQTQIEGLAGRSAETAKSAERWLGLTLGAVALGLALLAVGAALAL